VVAAALSGALLTLVPARAARAADGEGEAPGGGALELSALAGIAAPSCAGGVCAGSFDAGPSVGGGALYRASPRWAVGVAASATRTRWSATYELLLGAQTAQPTVSSTVTNGLVGASARLTPAPQLRVSPIVDMTVGVAFQTETRTDVRCNDGVNPGASVGGGVRVRLPPVSVLAMGVAALAMPFQSCALSDGAPATPLGSVTLGVLVGMSVDLGLGAGGGAS
jgi:hypothetical protein